MKLFSYLRSKFTRFTKDEEGASGIEYAIIAGLVVVVLATFVTPISNAVRGIFTGVETAVTAASGDSSGD